MKKEMLINVLQPEECRIAIIENGVLEELYVERTSQESYVGNIYKGRIVNIEPSIQAAFVDFGIGRNGFLHISDVDPAYYKHLDQRGGDRDRGGRDRDRGGGRGGPRRARGGPGGGARGEAGGAPGGAEPPPASRGGGLPRAAEVEGFGGGAHHRRRAGNLRPAGVHRRRVRFPRPRAAARAEARATPGLPRAGTVA